MFGDMVFEMTRSFDKKQFKLKERMNGQNIVIDGGRSVW
jgi:hypothetical protein